QRTSAQIFRSHGQNHVDRDLNMGLAALQKQRNERLGLLASGVTLVSEQLFELIDEQKKIFARREPTVIAPLDDGTRPSRQEGSQPPHFVTGCFVRGPLRLIA